MMKRRNMKNRTTAILLAVICVLTSITWVNTKEERKVKADNAANASGTDSIVNDAGVSAAKIMEEQVEARTEFTRQFIMSDGSYTAVAYSMPVHYLKNGSWKEIDTTLVKDGKKRYKTKSTGLKISISKKADRKKLFTLKRNNTQLSVAPADVKKKGVKAAISNPGKKTAYDVINHNTVEYKNILKNTNITYDIFPEKITEIITVTKKNKNKAFRFRINCGKLKVRVKGKKVYFTNKKGKKKYTRLSTRITDANGVTSSKVSLSYNRKKGILEMKPDKKWWNSKKRKFPVEIRTTYITDKHERNVKVGAAYSGSPDSSFTYDRSLLLQADKCEAFIKMTSLPGLARPEAKILGASLHIKNEKELKMGAGKTFDIGMYKVKEKWNVNKLTYNDRPAYDTVAAATLSVRKKGDYECDVTSIVKDWYAGEGNYGTAIVADNSNRTYQARLDRNPYFTVHYEVTGFEGAVELKEGIPVTREVITAGQENYYYFDAKSGIAYDIYSDSEADTQAVMYDVNGDRTAYDDDSGTKNNFHFTGTYDGRRYIKAGIKDKGTGTYTIMLKKRFAVPKPVGIKGQDRYTVTWDAVENAKEYLVCVYDAGVKISETVVTGTSYDYVYTNETAGKILGYTVTARENSVLTGEPSDFIYNTSANSEWVYEEPVPYGVKNSCAVSAGGKIYVLGGESKLGASLSFEAYDTGTGMWEKLPDYTGSDTGICNSVMFTYNNEIYVIGGQTDTGTASKVSGSVCSYDIGSKKWQRKADMAEGRTNNAYALCRNKVYIFSRTGAVDRTEVYDIKTDTWDTVTLPDTSVIIDAVSVDDRIFVLIEDGDRMHYEEYLPDDNIYDNAGAECPYSEADRYKSAVINGKIYMVRESDSREVLVYDTYTDEWSRVSDMNLAKKYTTLVSSGNDLYSIGGELTGFGVLNVVEKYSVKEKTIIRQMSVNKGEAYELQIEAGHMDKGMSQIVTVNVNPDELHIQNASSYASEEELSEGKDGVTLLNYSPEKGLIVLKLTGSLERGDSYESYQSIPVEAVTDGIADVKITLNSKNEK